MNKKIYEMLLVLLTESGFVSSTFLSQEIEVSTRTIKRYMKDIPNQLSEIDFSIESNKNGYRIVVTEDNRIKLLEEMKKMYTKI